MTVAWILAAGLGSRLAPLTHERPKPLVEVCGRPLVVHALQLLARAGVVDVAMNSHWLHPALPQGLRRFGDDDGGGNRDGTDGGCVVDVDGVSVAVRFTHEPTPLGTGGGLLGLRHRLPPQADGRVVIANADALIDLDVAAFMQRRRPGSLASLALKSVDDVARYGAIGTDDRDRVTTFAGRITPRGPVTRERMFCGWHDVDAAALDILPAVSVDDSQDPPVVTGPESCINKEGYPKHLEAGADIFGVDVDGGVGGGFFFDVGTPERLFEANRLLLSGDVKLVALAPFARFQEREGRVFVHPSAKISDDATVVGPCVIDADAVVESGATVDAWSVLGRRVTVRRGVKVSRAVVQGARGDAPHVVSDDAIAVHVGETCRMGII